MDILDSRKLETNTLIEAWKELLAIHFECKLWNESTRSVFNILKYIFENADKCSNIFIWFGVSDALWYINQCQPIPNSLRWHTKPKHTHTQTYNHTNYNCIYQRISMRYFHEKLEAVLKSVCFISFSYQIKRIKFDMKMCTIWNKSNTHCKWICVG